MQYFRNFYSACQQLLSINNLKPHLIQVQGGGLECISEGLVDMNTGRVRAKKVCISCCMTTYLIVAYNTHQESQIVNVSWGNCSGRPF